MHRSCHDHEQVTKSSFLGGHDDPILCDLVGLLGQSLSDGGQTWKTFFQVHVIVKGVFLIVLFTPGARDGCAPIFINFRGGDGGGVGGSKLLPD
jgi:hypothetical protein